MNARLLIGNRCLSFLFLALLACEPGGDNDLTNLAAITLPEEARFVEVAVAERRQLTQQIPFLGILKPAKIITLHFPVSGRLRGCLVQEGDLVQMGDVLCTLDSAGVDLEIKRAQEALQAARQILDSNFLDKQKELFEAGVIGQSEFEQIRVQNETARAQLRDAESLLDMANRKKAEHTLRAPWSGRIAGLSLSAGQLVSPEVSIGHLVSLDALQIEARLHASWYGKIMVGDGVRVNSVSGQQLKVPLLSRVTNVGTRVNPESQMFEVLLALVHDRGNENSQFAAGMLVKGDILADVAGDGVVIPLSSLFEWSAKGQGVVFVVESGRAQSRQVDVLTYSGEDVLISSGLEESDVVLRHFLSGAYSGMPVRFSHPPQPSREEP